MRLNLVSDGADRELEAVKCTIERFETATGLEHVHAILCSYANRGHRTELIDAIGHSQAHGFLVLGAWVIDDSPQTGASFSELLRPVLAQLGVRAIRVLGCSTAITERGKKALRRVAHAARCQVLGSKRYLSKHDYGPTGFVSDHALISV
jgi:hypothetical protein